MTDPLRIAKGLYWDRALSLVGGCTPLSPGCDNCWSCSETHMRAAQSNPKILARYGGLTEGGKWNGQIRLHRDRMKLPLGVKKTTVWAVWNDLFHESIEWDFIQDALWNMGQAKQHTFLVLTKRAERLKFLRLNGPIIGSEFPSNVWLGVTVESGDYLWRIEELLRTPTAVRWVSVEPMLGPVNLKAIPHPYRHPKAEFPIYVDPSALNWVVCGSESGPNRRPAKLEWIRDLRDQCVAAGVHFFLKQAEIDGKLIKMPELDGQIWCGFPEVLQ